MALTYTPPATGDSRLPAFDLPTVDGRRLTDTDLLGGKAALVMFICNHCPYVKAVENRLILLAHQFTPRGLKVAAICSNDPTDYPEDSPESLHQRWREMSYGFPYLIDETQDVARAFGAVCTPDLFLYDGRGTLRYRGRLDDSWKNPENVKNEELKAAIEALLAGKAVNPQQNPSMGCSIKWKNG